MLTEEEAKTKVCHRSLSRATSSGGYGQQTNCIGSACMAWCSQSQWRRRSDYPWEDGEPTIDALNTERRKIGFCGLVGKP